MLRSTNTNTNQYHNSYLSFIADCELTQKEIEILQLVLNGEPPVDIAVKLNNSINTIKVHMAHICRKLHVNTIHKICASYIKHLHEHYIP